MHITTSRPVHSPAGLSQTPGAVPRVHPGESRQRSRIRAQHCPCDLRILQCGTPGLQAWYVVLAKPSPNSSCRAIRPCSEASDSTAPVDCGTCTYGDEAVRTPRKEHRHVRGGVGPTICSERCKDRRLHCRTRCGTLEVSARVSHRVDTSHRQAAMGAPLLPSGVPNLRLATRGATEAHPSLGQMAGRISHCPLSA